MYDMVTWKLINGVKYVQNDYWVWLELLSEPHGDYGNFKYIVRITSSPLLMGRRAIIVAWPSLSCNSEWDESCIKLHRQDIRYQWHDLKWSECSNISDRQIMVVILEVNIIHPSTLLICEHILAEAKAKSVLFTMMNLKSNIERR